MASDWGLISALGTGLAGVIATSAVADIASRTFSRAEEKLRTRLHKEILGSPVTLNAIDNTGDEVPLAPIDPDLTARLRKALDAATADSPGENFETEESSQLRLDLAEGLRKALNAEPVGSTDGGPDVPISQREVASSAHNARFGVLLVDYYAFGLTQARRSFAVSMACSVLGGLVLIAGVALAIFRADTNGELYAGVVTSVAGVLTTSIGVLFHQQANRALKHMEDQTNKLRQDMKAESDAETALALLEKVADGGLRGRLQAALVLRFAAAELPDIDAFGSPINTNGEMNGDRPGSHLRPTASDKRA